MSNASQPQDAIVLFAHGSRQATWREPFEQVEQQLKQQRPDVRVELAFLEFMAPNLSESLNQIVTQGIHRITIVPLFFGVGNHVARDLDELVQAFTQKHPTIQITIAPAVGQSSTVLDAMANYAATCVK